MTRAALALAHDIQGSLLQIAGRGPVTAAPRILLDGWATLYRWHLVGQPVTRLTDEHEAAILARPLAADLPLATAPLRREAIGIQLPDRSQWIAVARHAPTPAEIIVRDDVRWAYGQPVLTYATEIDGDLVAGYFSLDDMPTPRDLQLRPGISLGLAGPRALDEAEVAEEDYRIALALATLYRQHRGK